MDSQDEIVIFISLCIVFCASNLSWLPASQNHTSRRLIPSKALNTLLCGLLEKCEPISGEMDSILSESLASSSEGGA